MRNDSELMSEAEWADREEQYYREFRDRAALSILCALIHDDKGERLSFIPQSIKAANKLIKHLKMEECTHPVETARGGFYVCDSCGKETCEVGASDA